MTPKEYASSLVEYFWADVEEFKQYETIKMTKEMAKQCALIAVENEYNSLREMLFNLRSCQVIESEKVYLFRLQKLINEEQEVKQEIELL